MRVPQLVAYTPKPRELPRPRLATDERGNLFAEYVIVLGTVALAVGLAIYALGVPLARSFYLARLFILLPIP